MLSFLSRAGILGVSYRVLSLARVREGGASGVRYTDPVEATPLNSRVSLRSCGRLVPSINADNPHHASSEGSIRRTGATVSAS